MTKISALPPDTTPVPGDIIPFVQISGPTTSRMTVQNLLNVIAANSYNPYKFSVYRSTTFNSPNNTTAKIVYDTKLYDTGSNFDAVTNGRFTVPAGGGGLYRFSARAEALNAGGSSHRMFLSLYKNGVELNRGVDTTSGAAATPIVGVVCPPLIALVPTDYIEVFIYTDGILVVNNGSSLNYFGGELVSAT